MALPFEQQPNESAKAFAAFKCYLDMGPDRTCPLVAAKCSRSVSLINRWSSIWNWPDRVRAKVSYDEQLHREADAKAAEKDAAKWAERVRQVREQGWQNAQLLIQRSREMLEVGLFHKVKTGKGKKRRTVLRPTGWRVQDAARMLDVAEKLQRLATGMATERQEVSGTPAGAPVPVTATVTVDLAGLDVKELELLEQIAIKTTQAQPPAAAPTNTNTTS